MERASQTAEAYLNGNRNDARAAVLASERPDLMALDVLTDLLDACASTASAIEMDRSPWEMAQYVSDRWRNCLAGGL